MSIYWSDSENIFKNKSVNYDINDLNGRSKSDLYNILLQIEKKILLHPRNAHMLFMPVIDDLLKKDAFKQIVIDAKGQSKDSTTFMQALTPQKNVEKAIQFIKSKFGVGVVALDITGHSVFGSQNINLARAYNNPSDEYRPTPTNLLFEGLENNYSLTSMYDANNRIISEVQSQTMNSQVDAGKDPYAVLLGINNQTLGIMMYLVRRGVPVTTVLKFLSQPMIQQYLVEQRKNESVINKQRGDEISKDALISKIYTQNGIKRQKLDRSKSFNDKDLDKGIRNNKIDSDQGAYFEYFLTLIDETGAFNDLKNGITVDTKGKKDKASVENFEKLWDKINRTQIISAESLEVLKNDSVLSPFFKAQELYRKIYFPFYALDSSAFGDKLKNFKDMMSDRQRGVFKKEKVRTVIENDFLLFLIQNSHADFNQSSFDELFGFSDKDSLAIEIKKAMNNPLYSQNPVLKAFFPLISIGKDTVHKNEQGQFKMFDAIRLFERQLTTIDLNDFTDAMKDIRDDISEELYKKIIQVGLYQAGFNNSPFSLNKVFPTFKSSTRVDGKLTEFQNDYLREIQISTLNRIPELELNADSLFDQFEELFYRNNTEFLPRKYSQYSPIKFFYTFSKTDNKYHLFYKESKNHDNIYVSELGGTYFKRYFVSNAIGVGSTTPVTKSEEVEYTPFEEISSTKADPQDFVNYSGAAQGADTAWENMGKEFGIGKQVNYRPESLKTLTEEQSKEVETAYRNAVKFLGRKVLEVNTFAGGLVRRDYLQAKAGNAVFAIVEGFDVKNKIFLPKGGTAYAIVMADQLGKKVNVFDQSKNKWYSYKNGILTEIETPILTKKFTGVGTRQLKENGEQAIRDVYEKTFNNNEYIEPQNVSNPQPQQLSLFDDTFTADEAQEAADLKKECKGSKTTIIK